MAENRFHSQAQSGQVTIDLDRNAKSEGFLSGVKTTLTGAALLAVMLLNSDKVTNAITSDKDLAKGIQTGAKAVGAAIALGASTKIAFRNN